MHFTAPQLRDRRVNGAEFTVHVTLEALVEEGPTDAQIRLDVCEHITGVLKVQYAVPKRVALTHVLARDVQGTLRCAH